MRKLFISVGLALATMGSALAADLPVKAPVYVNQIPPATPWQGLYLGFNVGGGWQNQDQSISGDNSLSQAIVNSGFVPGSLATRGDGMLVGGQVGYNFQFNRFVVGPEFDFDWSGIKGSDSQALSLGKFSLLSSASSRTNWLSTIRARAGYLVMPATLLYVTGGGAFGDVHENTSITLATPIKGLNGAAISDVSSVRWGWVVGAGLEQKIINDLWSIKAEYNYVDLGSINTNPQTVIYRQPISFTGNQDLRYHVFKVGLNYKIW